MDPLKPPRGQRYCKPCGKFVKPIQLAGMPFCSVCERGPLVMTAREARAEERESQ